MVKNIFRKIIEKILKFEARLILKKYKPKIIGVTGNVGKTGTKEAIHSVLQDKFNVRKSEKSYNNELGVPVTIIGKTKINLNAWGWVKTIIEGLLLLVFKLPYPKWLILEVGVDRPGDMKKILDWIDFDVVVLTRIPDVPVHIEFFKSHKEFVDEKTLIVKSLSPDKTAILNFDDKHIREVGDSLKCNKIYFGSSEGASVRFSNQTISYKEEGGVRFPEGISFKLDYEGSSMPIRVKGVVGFQQIYSILPAIAVGILLDLNIVDIAESIGEHISPPGRYKLLSGIKDTLIIDDTYNSSPVALEAAIKTFGEIECSGRKIAVLGDMLELGSHTVEEHKKVGKDLVGVVDILFVVGLRAKFFAESAIENGFSKSEIFYFDEAVSAGKALQSMIKSGDIILVKGSQGIRLEKTVEEVMAEPEKRRALLARQGPEWRTG